MLAQSSLIDLDGREAAAAHRSFVDTPAEAPPHGLINLQSSNGSGNFTAEAARDASDNSTNSSASVPVEESIRDGVVQESDAYGAVLSNDAEIGVQRIEEKKDEEVQINCSKKCASEVQVFEHTEFINHDESGSKRNWKQQEPKEKRPKRRGGRGRRNNEGLNCYLNERREKKGLMYSREEMEALRFEELEEQKKKWIEIYCRLGATVVDEYDGLVRLDRAREKDSVPSFDFDPRPQFQKCANLGKEEYSREEMEALRFEELEEQKKKWIEIYCRLGATVVDEYDGLVRLDRAREKDSVPSFDFDPRPQFQKCANLGEVCPKVEGDHLENLNASDPPSFPPISDERGSSAVEEDYCEDDDSDEEYSIQRPAFSVTGEPDFDSGPPLDGLEYLRRVRWEAARIPKVKVVRVNKVKQQSVYMPQIPDVMKCPENLLPLKQWEDSFLSDFSQLREAFAQLDLEEPTAETSTKEDFLNQMVESNNFEKFVNLESVDDSCILETSDAKSGPSSPESSVPKVDRPTLSAILKMDSAARTSLLKKRVNSVVNMDVLPYNDGLWLFALCAALDCPLHADTSASLRSLLRKCASLRAAKAEVDDEVVALNILVTITGKYFGQLERE